MIAADSGPVLVSVIIPTWNPGPDLDRVLARVRAQRLAGALELLIVDSGSTDGTPERARAHGARVECIPQREFYHGRTRNLGARLASGRFLVFLSQDVELADDDTLATLVAACDAPGVLAAYARQMARDDALPMERFFLDRIYGPTPRRTTPESLPRTPPGSILYSNAAAIVRRDDLLAQPFHDTLIMSEDVEWSYRRIRGGATIVYEPRARVWHSHAYTLRALFKRNFDSAFSLRGVFAYTFADVLRLGFAHVLAELAWLWRQGHAAAIPHALAHEATRFVGLFLGKRAPWLPRSWCRALSSNAKWWDQTDPSRRPAHSGAPPPARCACCGGARLALAYATGDRTLEISRRPFDLYRCRDCDGGMTCPPLTPEETPGVYPQDYWLEAPATARERVESALRTALILDRVVHVQREAARQRRSRCARVLDIGCSDAVLLAVLRARGHACLGLDVSAIAVRQARRRGVDAQVGGIESLPAESRFDIITLFHTLEHVAEPVALLRQVRSRLAPGGALIVEVPDWTCAEALWFGEAWEGLDIPRHQTHFGARALAMALRRAGFRIEQCWRFSPQVSTSTPAHSLAPACDPRWRRAHGLPVTLGSQLVHLALTAAASGFALLQWSTGRGAVAGALARPHPEGA